MASKSASKHRVENESLKELKREVDRKINEIREDVIEGKTASAEEALDNLRYEVEAMMSELHDHVDESLELGREAIRERPLVSIGAAVGAGILAGMVLGVLLGKKGKD